MPMANPYADLAIVPRKAGTVRAAQGLMIRSCYGRQCDRLDECATCLEHPWCSQPDARDPKPLTGPTPGAVAGGDAAYEAAQQEPHPQQEHDPGATTTGSELAHAIIQASQGNPARGWTILCRLDGWSYEAIGKSLGKVKPGKSRVAVMKDVNAIAAVSPELGHLLRQKFARTEDPQSLNGRLFAAYCELRPVWHARLQGPCGLYSMLANQFGIAGWNAARHRIEAWEKPPGVYGYGLRIGGVP
jgi:hypothetical protein